MTKKTENKKFIIEVIGEQIKVNKYGDKLHSLIDDLGWEYQRMGLSLSLIHISEPTRPS